MAVMFLEDGIGDGQPQPAAVVFRCKVGIKNLGNVLLVDAATGISDLQLDEIPAARCREAGDVNTCDVAAVDINGAGAGDGLLAVDDNALKDLADLA